MTTLVTAPRWLASATFKRPESFLSSPPALAIPGPAHIPILVSVSEFRDQVLSISQKWWRSNSLSLSYQAAKLNFVHEKSTQQLVT